MTLAGIPYGAFSRIFPFVLYLAFIGLEDVMRFLISKGCISISPYYPYYLYPIKAVSVAAVLLLFMPRYSEINLRDLARAGQTTVSLLVGLLVFIVWIHMDMPFATIGHPEGLNPHLLPGKSAQTLFSLIRISGAVVVVPIMEELFWRSFLIRYLIDDDFAKVPLGGFTWRSFIFTSVLFGLEHNFFLAGLMAGVAYNVLLYRSKSLSQCIVAHAVTNLALGIFVLHTGKWYFW